MNDVDYIHTGRRCGVVAWNIATGATLRPGDTVGRLATGSPLAFQILMPVGGYLIIDDGTVIDWVDVPYADRVIFDEYGHHAGIGHLTSACKRDLEGAAAFVRASMPPDDGTNLMFDEQFDTAMRRELGLPDHCDVCDQLNDRHS